MTIMAEAWLMTGERPVKHLGKIRLWPGWNERYSIAFVWPDWDRVEIPVKTLRMPPDFACERVLAFESEELFKAVTKDGND